eukprot:GHVN01067941.1.p4 GENE.GHVN01067941.1~~GHVN01067941.1.p4  ORF type:complete len:154 (+),score=4.75 GHVN01067941.1:1624-2085(+)
MTGMKKEHNMDSKLTYEDVTEQVAAEEFLQKLNKRNEDMEKKSLKEVIETQKSTKDKVIDKCREYFQENKRRKVIAAGIILTLILTLIIICMVYTYNYLAKPIDTLKGYKPLMNILKKVDFKLVNPVVTVIKQVGTIVTPVLALAVIIKICLD